MVAVKSTLEKPDVEQILAYYDVGVIEDVKAFTTGTVQTNILLHTTCGRFVLRYYERNRSFNSVLFEVNLIKYLKRKNYPCPAAVGNTHGKFAACYKDKPYALFEFLEGTHVQHPNERQKQQLIQKVAELQNLTRNYRSAYTQYRWNYGIGLCETLVGDTANTIATANAQEKLTWYRHELSKLVLPASLPKGICHCDFHFSNVLFKDDTFHALLDYDDANYTFLTFDLGYLIEPFIPMFRWDTWRNFTLHDEVFNFADAKKIVSEYQKYRTLNPTEKKYFFDVYKLGVLIDCLWFFKRGDARDFYEKRKIEYLNRLGRETFYYQVFG